MTCAGPIVGNLVPESEKEGDKFVGAAVDVADEVEGPVLVAPVGPEPFPFDGCSLDLLDTAQREDPPEPLALETLDRPSELLVLASHSMCRQVAVRASCVSFGAHLPGHVEHDRHREDVVLPGQPHQRGARASRWTLVASTTVRRPASSRLPAM